MMLARVVAWAQKNPTLSAVIEDLPTKPMPFVPLPTVFEDAAAAAASKKALATLNPQQRSAISTYTDPSQHRCIRVALSGRGTPEEIARVSDVLDVIDRAIDLVPTISGVFWRGMYRVDALTLNCWLGMGLIPATDRPWSMTRSMPTAMEATQWAQPPKGWRVIMRITAEHAVAMDALSKAPRQREVIVASHSTYLITDAYIVAGSRDLIMIDCTQVAP